MKNRKQENTKKQLPLELMSNLPIMEFTGNQQALIEGSKGVLQYEREIVKINTNNIILVFNGRNLSIKSISPTTVILQGYITNVEFIV